MVAVAAPSPIEPLSCRNNQRVLCGIALRTARGAPDRFGTVATGGNGAGAAFGRVSADDTEQALAHRAI